MHGKVGPSPLPVRSHLTFLRLLGHGVGGGNVAEAALGALRQEGPCWGQLQDELGPRVPLGEETKALCGRLPTPTQQGQLSQHKGCTVSWAFQRVGGMGWKVGPGNGYGARRSGGPEWQWREVEWLSRAQGNTQVPEQAWSPWPPSHVCPAEVWRGLSLARPSRQGLGLHLGSSQAVPGGWPGFSAHAQPITP